MEKMKKHTNLNNINEIDSKLEKNEKSLKNIKTALISSITCSFLFMTASLISVFTFGTCALTTVFGITTLLATFTAVGAFGIGCRVDDETEQLKLRQENMIKIESLTAEYSQSYENMANKSETIKRTVVAEENKDNSITLQ